MTDKLSNEELSAEVARRLFGRELPLGIGTLRGSFYTEPYAEDHNAALGLVVPEMRKRGYIFTLEDKGSGWVEAIFYGEEAGIWSEVAPYGEEPRAICLAALAALDSEGETK